jgi:signal transduction histidine kinase
MKLHFQKRMIVGFILTLIILAGLGVYAFLTTQRLIETARLLSHATRVINNAEQLLAITINLETGQHGFVITGNEDYLAPYDTALKNTEQHVQQLLTVTLEDPAQHERIKRLELMIRQRIEQTKQVIEARKIDFQSAQSMILSGEGMVLMDNIRSLIRKVQEQERQVFRAQNTITSKSLVQFQFAFVGLIVAPALIILILFHSINRNFNARNRVEKQLRKASSEIQHLNQELEAYTFSVSHDLRAPLRAIDGYSQILNEDYGEKLDSEGKRVIRVIINNARRMGQLIDDLLDFSRIGRKEMIKTDFDIQVMVQEVVEELTEHRNGHPVRIEVLPLEPATGDFSMLRQVWVNLISNAIKYSGKKQEARIEIGSFHEPDKTCYYVKDNGVGFNMKYIDKLFGVFQRLHKSDEFEGTGVGLALVKRIVHRHGGSIWAEAKVGEGATFYFSLPKQ